MPAVNISCTSLYIQGNLYIVDAIGTQVAVLYILRGVPKSEVDLYTALCGWDCRQCSYWRGVP